jgi:hypothetical protein
MLMFSLAGIPPLFGFWGKFVVFQAAVEADLMALAVLGIAASVIGAFYYIKIVKVMYFDEPADTVRGKSDWAHWALLAISAVVVSPLGYLATGWLGNWRMAPRRRCSRSPDLPIRIEFVAQTGSTNMDLLGRIAAGKRCRRATGWSPTARPRAAAGRAQLARRAGQFHGLDRGQPAAERSAAGEPVVRRRDGDVRGRGEPPRGAAVARRSSGPTT